MYVVKEENLKGLKEFTDSIDWDLEYDNLYLSNKFKNENINKKNKVLDLEKEETRVDFLNDLLKKYIYHIDSGGTLFGFKLILNEQEVLFKCKGCFKGFLHQDISVGFNRDRINVYLCSFCNKKNKQKWIKNNDGNNWQNNYQKNRNKTDHLFRFKNNIRSLISHSFKRKGDDWVKESKTENILGCRFNYFNKYIENKFIEGMNFSNYGEWHLDHIKPLALAKTKEDVITLNHYTNFQPLWAEDNFKKGSKY